MKPDPILFPALRRRPNGLAMSHRFQRCRARRLRHPDCTIKDGRRHSTARAFLDPAKARSNFRVETNALVTRILIEGGRATGVEFSRGGQTHIVRARREVILSAGALNSPQVLKLSGIGPFSELQALGIFPRLNVPGVGANLQDHPIALSFWNASKPVTFDSKIRLDRLVGSFLQWQLTGKGTMSQSPMSIQGFLRSSAAQDRPDWQFQIVHSSYAARPWFPAGARARGHQFSLGVLLLNPESRGSVTLRSPDPAVAAQGAAQFPERGRRRRPPARGGALHAQVHDGIAGK